jgi:hypothetical protein
MWLKNWPNYWHEIYGEIRKSAVTKIRLQTCYALKHREDTVWDGESIDGG